jgi:trigger factor
MAKPRSRDPGFPSFSAFLTLGATTMSDEQQAVTEEPTTLAPEAPPEPAVKEKLQQKVDITDVGPCKKHIKVAIDRGAIDKQLGDKYKQLMDESHVPGFRPGKAPRSIVVRKYRKEVFGELKNELLLASLEQLAEDHDVAPLSPPNLNLAALEIPDAGDFIYEFDVEVRPEFDLPDYKGLKLKRPVRTFSDADVAAEQDRLFARHGQLVPKDGAAEKGDYLVVDMTTKFGERIVGEAKELTLRIDDTVTFRDGVVPHFAEKMAGAKAGDVRVIDVSMTDAVAQNDLKGQTVQATLEIKDVKKMRLPEINEEFLQQFGAKTLDQLGEIIRINLERRLEYEQRQSAREQVLNQISASSTWQLPEDLLHRQARKSLARRVMEMREAGIGEEEIKARERILERNVLASTAASLKEHFVLQKIAEVEKIDVDESDISAEVERIAAQYGESPRRVRAQMEKEDLLETLGAQLIERKALDLILETAEYEDVSAAKETSMSASETQAVHGEMQDPTAVPPAPEPETPTEEKKD